MTFPQTRLTLIQRLTADRDERDWRQFFDDYWGPICGFAARWGRLSAPDAEEVASQTFEVLLRSNLLLRWRENRTARLRTLLCQVARNVMANQARREQGRKRILAELAQSASGDAPGRVWDSAEPSVELEDVFYHAWASDLLQRSVQNVLLNLHAVGKGDYFRVLYGRLCEELSTREVAEFLEISAGTVENYFKAAKKLLAQELEAAVRTHVARYCPPSEQEDEYRREWGFLSEHLAAHGGLEQAIRQCHKLSAPEAGRRPLETSRRACGHWLTGVSSSGSQHGLE